MDVVTEARCEIYKGSKRDHFKSLQTKTGVPYSRMCVFDDDMKAMFEQGLIPSREIYEDKVRQILGLE